MCCIEEETSDLWGDLCLRQSRGEEITYKIQRDDGYTREERMSFYFSSQISDVEKSVLSSLKGPVLDFGCGPGRSTRYLREHGIECIPVDNSEGIARLFKDKNDKTFKKIDIRNLEAFRQNFSACGLGAILLNGNNLGLLGELSLLKEFARVSYSHLREGGLFVASSIDYKLSHAEHHQLYQKRNLESGRYPGNVRIRLKWGKLASGFWNLMLIAKEDIEEILYGAGFKEIEFIDDSHAYFVRAKK